MEKFRVGYIDMLRGFTMLWVVCLHLELSIGIANDFRMPILFFISGIFFKIKPFPEFFVRKTNMIFIPLLFFWMLTWICAIVKDELIPVRFQLRQVDWESVFSLFSKYSYMEINVLWFLMVLYVMNLFYYLPVKFFARKYYVLSISIILYLATGYIDSKVQIPMFTLWRFLTYQLFFVLGIYYGRQLLKWIAAATPGRQYIVGGICLTVFVVCQIIDWDSPPFDMIPKRIHNFMPSVALIVMLFGLFNKLERFGLMAFFRFFGANSLTIYASHIIILNYILLVFIDPIVKRYFDVDAYPTLYGWVQFFLICGIGYIFIRFFNRYLPQFVGKKDLFKIPGDKSATSHQPVKNESCVSG